MFSTAFARALLERAVRTFAQSLVAVGLVGATDVLNANWTEALSVAALATILSALTSIAAGAISPATGPSLGTEVPTATSGDPDRRV